MQSVKGHLELLSKKQSISRILNTQDTDKQLRKKLALVLDIREFASEHLSLPHNNSYTEYADLGRNFVVWNVFATPELSLQPKQWCFLFVGCLNYRGYYSELAANRYAQSLAAEGYDVFVGGVTAYSTLGWLNDPVLNTMLDRGDDYLVSVIFHELSHQKIYIRDDTSFNEAFAETVAMTGGLYWLEQYGSVAAKKRFLDKQSEQTVFINLILKYKAKLENIYRSELSNNQKREHKALLLTQLIKEYQDKSGGKENAARYTNWLSTNLNNAKLASVITYQDYVSGFQSLFDHSHDNHEKFYELVKKLSKCDLLRRKFIIENNITEFQC